jgi:hypothetical protein
MTVDRFAESEKVADGLAFLRLLRRMAMDWEDQRQKEIKNPQQSWGFDGEPPKAVMKDFGTRDGTS